MHASSSRNIVDLEKALGYTFKNRNLLEDALTHKSFYHENPDEGAFHNERLEFLGDTVLALVIAELLYSLEQPRSESEMSRIKSYLVSGAVLSSIARTLEVGSYLNLGKGEIGTGGRKKSSILADSMEALFGAVFIDSGFAEARKVILALYRDVVRDAFENQNYLDHKTELQECSQRMFGVLPCYRVISERGKEHEKYFEVEVSIGGEVYGTGGGKSKKKAETAAAKDALSKIPKD